MSKGNSGLLSKHQAKIPYTSRGVIGNEGGYEVLTEVVVRFRSKNAGSTNSVTLQGRMANDDVWENIKICTGFNSCIAHIASWDYIRFNCDVLGGSPTLISSAFFSDGIFVVDAINNLQEKQQKDLLDIKTAVCYIKDRLDKGLLHLEEITEEETEGL